MKDEFNVEENFLDFQDQLESLWDSNQFESLIEDVGRQLFLNRKPISKWKPDNEDKRDGYGLYAFWIDESQNIDFYDFKSKWNIDRKDKSLSQPYKKWYNLEVIKETSERKVLYKQKGNRCFYLGKREQVFHRIRDHINGSSESTYGLHLYRKDENFKKSLSVGYWQIPDQEMSRNKQSPEIKKLVRQHLISYLESELRFYLSPMVGKQ